MMRSAVSIKFYVCPWQTFDEAIDPCERELYDWLLSIDPPRPSWTPQALMITDIRDTVTQRIIDRHAACEAGRFAQATSPPSGVEVAVATRLDGAAASNGEAADGLRAPLTVGFRPQTGCPQVPFHVLNIPQHIGSTLYQDSIHFTPAGDPPQKNGVGQFADSIVFDLVNQDTEWRTHIHRVFTRGTWNIHANIVFGHFAQWALIDNPPPGASLQARGESFSLASMSINGDLYNGRFRILHRYSHQQSGRVFWFIEWVSFAEGWVEVGPPVYGTWGLGFNGAVTFDSFEVPDIFGSDFWDPEGTWLHRSGIVDFAASFAGQVKYSSALCNEFLTTFSESSIDPATTAFIGSNAYFEEEVEVRTIRQYKACWRLVSVDPVPGFGVTLTLRLLNEFGFPACVVARSPLGSGWRRDGVQVSKKTIWVARSLPAGSESDPVRVNIPFSVFINAAASPLTISYTKQDIDQDVSNGGGAAVQGFVCADGAFADNAYVTSINSLAQALDATSTAKATAFGFYVNGNRFSTPSASDGATELIGLSVSDAPSAGDLNRAPFVASVHASYQYWDGSEYKTTTGNFWMWDQYGQNLATPARVRERYGAFVTIFKSELRRFNYPGHAYHGKLFCDTWSNGDREEMLNWLWGLFCGLVIPDGNAQIISVNVWPTMMFSDPACFDTVSEADGVPELLDRSIALPVFCCDDAGSDRIKVCLR